MSTTELTFLLDSEYDRIWNIDIGGSIMLYTIIGILVVLWLLGFSMHVGGGLIHALLVIAVVVLLYNFLRGRHSLN